jgi:hypothetical protein
MITQHPSHPRRLAVNDSTLRVSSPITAINGTVNDSLDRLKGLSAQFV